MSSVRPPIAGLADSAFGQAATAVCYLMVCIVALISEVAVCYRTSHRERFSSPEHSTKIRVKPMQSHDANDVVTLGVIIDLLSASVLACPLLGVVPELFSGHVPWLWTAGVFQLGVCVKSYRSMDPWQPLSTASHPSAVHWRLYRASGALHKPSALFPTPFQLYSQCCFSSWPCLTCREGFMNTIYQLFFVAYCIAIASEPQSFFQRGTQGVQAAIFIVSTLCSL